MRVGFLFAPRPVDLDWTRLPKKRLWRESPELSQSKNSDHAHTFTENLLTFLFALKSRIILLASVGKFQEVGEPLKVDLFQGVVYVAARPPIVWVLLTSVLCVRKGDEHRQALESSSTWKCVAHGKPIVDRFHTLKFNLASDGPKVMQDLTITESSLIVTLKVVSCLVRWCYGTGIGIFGGTAYTEQTT